jgi:hypothetical protein
MGNSDPSAKFARVVRELYSRINVPDELIRIELRVLRDIRRIAVNQLGRHAPLQCRDIVGRESPRGSNPFATVIPQTLR